MLTNRRSYSHSFIRLVVRDRAKSALRLTVTLMLDLANSRRQQSAGGEKLEIAVRGNGDVYLETTTDRV
jgi:hypothetical protein